MKETNYFMDTDVIVNAFIEFNKRKYKTSQVLLEKLEQGSVTLITDYLVLTEAHYTIEKYKGVVKATEIAKKLLTFDGLEIVAVDGFTFFEAMKRAKKYKLKVNDLVHYTIALLNSVDGIYSYDKDFNGLEIKRVEP